MNSDPWWDYFDEDPLEKIGRLVPGAFGHPVTVVLARISWNYLAWLEDRYDGDIGKFFQINHRHYDPRECSFDDWMEGAIADTFVEYEKDGSPRPEWLRPAEPWEMMDI